jgi:5-carboxyvanillate decarboxylase
MWAVDYPVQPMGPAVKFLESASLSAEERTKIAHRNAELMFGLSR